MKKKAFTLIEVILTVALLAISTGLVTAWTLSTLDRAELQSTTEAVTGVMRKTQSAAHDNRNNLAHGIRLENNQYTTFEGNSFDASAAATRQVFSVASSVQLSNINLSGGGSDIVFASGTGETSQNGSFQIVEPDSSEAFTISITPLGLIDWQ